MKDDEEYIKEQIFLQIVDGVIIIPKDFDHRVVNKEKAIYLYKDDRKIETLYIEQQVDKYFVFLNALLKEQGSDIEVLQKALKEKSNIIMIDENKESSSVDDWFVKYFNYTSYAIIAVYIAIIGMVMGEFRMKNIENRIKISSKKFKSFNKEIYLGQMVLAIIITSFFIIGSIVLKGKFINDVFYMKYILNIIIFSLAILCFAFLVNNITGNKLVINGISTVLSLGM